MLWYESINCRNIVTVFHEKKNRLYIITGADLASPTCHGTGCFFASSRGYAIKICLESFPISLEASWHWLILASIGALGNFKTQKRRFVFITHLIWDNIYQCLNRTIPLRKCFINATDK